MTENLLKKGCCGRSFAKGKKDKKKRKKSGKGSKKPYRTRKYSIVSGLIQWKQMFTDIGVTREDILDNVRKNRIASKTYSTYAIDYKFRAKYVSLRIGTVPSVEPEPEKEVKKITKPIPKRKINTKFLTNFEINPNKKEVCTFQKFAPICLVFSVLQTNIFVYFFDIIGTSFKRFGPQRIRNCH